MCIGNLRHSGYLPQAKTQMRADEHSAVIQQCQTNLHTDETGGMSAEMGAEMGVWNRTSQYLKVAVPATSSAAAPRRPTTEVATVPASND